MLQNIWKQTTAREIVVRFKGEKFNATVVTEKDHLAGSVLKHESYYFFKGPLSTQRPA